MLSLLVQWFGFENLSVAFAFIILTNRTRDFVHVFSLDKTYPISFSVPLTTCMENFTTIVRLSLGGTKKLTFEFIILLQTFDCVFLYRYGSLVYFCLKF